MTRLAGIAAYALLAALVLVAPLSASEDPMPEPAAPEATEQPQDALLQPSEPAAAAPEAAPPEPPSAETTPPPDPTAPAEQTPLPQPSPAPTEPAVEELEEAAPSKPTSRRAGNAPRATAAADTGVTISDFQFAPSSVTIDAGDTVTWTNEGPTAHSATADDGSFDTGVFEQGQSRSHTFEQAGTFSYFCTPHPNMRGTVTVRAASTGGSGNGAGGGGESTGGTTGESGAAAAGSGASSGSSGSELPATGLDAGGLIALGLMTLALGAWLRRRAAAAG